MARDIFEKDIDKMLSALSRMYKAANFGANASSLTVTQLKDIIDQVQYNFNTAKELWDGLVTLIGATEARNALSRRIAPVPADVSASLSSIQTAVVNLINAYAGSAYGVGSTAWTYDGQLQDGFITGGHNDSAVVSGVLTSVNSFCSTLTASLLVLAPVE